MSDITNIIKYKGRVHRCDCGKYIECCRKIYSNSHGKMWVEKGAHFRCGKVQKQISAITRS